MARRQTKPLEGEVLEQMPPPQAMTVVQQENPYTAMIQSVLKAGKDVSTVKEMLELQIAWEKNEAAKAYVAAMAAFKAEPMTILKRKEVSFRNNDGSTTSYMHAELSDCTDVIVPAMGKHGLSHRWDIKQEAGFITVTCTVTHKLGHSESVSMTAAPDQSGKKNLIQQVSSANSYLQRYTLLAITGMATKGMDDDAQGAYQEASQQGQPDAGGTQSAAAIARRKAEHDEALAEHSESVAFIKDRIAADDMQAVATEWRALGRSAQLALFLAPSKGGCFTTAERKAIHDRLPSLATAEQPE